MIKFNKKRILITRLRFIGDILLTTPLIQTLKERFPESYIAYMGEKHAVSLLNGNPFLDEIIEFDFNLSFFQYLKFIINLNKKKFDIVIDLFGNPRSAILTFLSGAKIRIGGDFRGRGKLYNYRLKEENIIRNQIEYHLSFVERFGVEPTTYKTHIYLNNDEVLNGKKILENEGIDFNKKTIGIYPGATWPAKRWFPERFAELTDLIINDLKYQVVFLQGKNDNDLIKIIKSKLHSNPIFLVPLELRLQAAIIKNLHIFISNDCGLMHISPAVGTKTIGLFGPGEDNIWFPYKHEDGHIAIRKEIWCHPCHLDFCDRMDCWKLLEPREIITHIEKI